MGVGGEKNIERECIMLFMVFVTLKTTFSDKYMLGILPLKVSQRHRSVQFSL